ncbi:MAG TPA: hypothetical protein PKD57_13785 [Saprospiraceae bacterium]|nr:hypothetical protein [Saprospiraceae bacterium]
MKTSQPINPDPSIRILKVATCPSLSGKSTLTYHIGSNAQSDIQFRIANNTGSGFFSKEWIALDIILDIFDQQPSNKPIVSLLLYPLFQGKSLNTPAFLLAVLRQEGLVCQLQDHPKHYERMSSDAFMAEIEKLIQSKADSKTDDAKSVAQVKKSASKNQISPS